MQTTLPSVCTKTTKGQYPQVGLNQARSGSSSLYGSWTLYLPAFKNKKIHTYNRSVLIGKLDKNPLKALESSFACEDQSHIDL